MNLFDLPENDVRKEPKRPAKGVNPLIAIYGDGPAGTTCKNCTYHYFRMYSKNYPKCAIRSTGAKHDGASTDHSSRLPACGKFEVKINP